MNATKCTTSGGLSVGALAPWAIRGGLVLWAGFWAWFVLADGISHIREGLKGTLPIMAIWLVSLTSLVVLAWRWPRIGGVALIGVGVFAAYFFHYPGVAFILALPPIALGVLSLLFGRTAAHAGRMPR